MRIRHAQSALRMLVPVLALLCCLAPTWALAGNGDDDSSPTLMDTITAWVYSLFEADLADRDCLGECGTNFGETGTNFGEAGTNYGEAGTNFGEAGTNLGEAGTN